MRGLRRLSPIAALLAATLVLTQGAWATHGPDTEVTIGSHDTLFSPNKQNEPWVAIDPSGSHRVAAGANDNIDLELCNPADDKTCPFTEKVGVTGFQGSTDGGLSFVQPTYTGWSARSDPDCVGVSGTDGDPACDPSPNGPIGTLPRYDEIGLVSDGDPITAWGPRPGPGGFSWSNGSRLYFSSLTSKLGSSGPGSRGPHEPFRGFEAISVSRTDQFESAVAGNEAAWLPPVLVQEAQSQTAFGDKESLWADNAQSSPFFGRVYVCWVEFRSVGSGPEPVKVARSADGGDTWFSRQISEAANPPGAPQGRQGCTVRTDSDGVVYVFWFGFEESQTNPSRSAGVRHIFLARSFDGGKSFERPRVVQAVRPCGRFDRIQGRLTFDGVAGARTNSFPIVDIANGAPTGNDATDAIALTWCNGPTPASAGEANEQALVSLSFDKGSNWTAPVNGAPPGHRPDFPAVALSPDGTDAYLVYMDFRQPWQPTTAAPRLFRGVVRHAVLTGTSLGGFASMHEGATGDARGSSANGLFFEFLGDYNAVSATRDFAVAVWNDARFAAACPKTDAYRQALVNGTASFGNDEPLRPAPNYECPQHPAASFGNTDIFGTRVEDPTP